MQIIASTSDEGHNNTSKNQEDVADENQSDSDTNISKKNLMRKLNQYRYTKIILLEM